MDVSLKQRITTMVALLSFFMLTMTATGRWRNVRPRFRIRRALSCKARMMPVMF